MTGIIIYAAIVAYALLGIGVGLGIRLQAEADEPPPILLCAFCGLIWPAWTLVRLGIWIARPVR